MNKLFLFIFINFFVLSAFSSEENLFPSVQHLLSAPEANQIEYLIALKEILADSKYIVENNTMESYQELWGLFIANSFAQTPDRVFEYTSGNELEPVTKAFKDFEVIAQKKSVLTEKECEKAKIALNLAFAEVRVAQDKKDRIRETKARNEFNRIYQLIQSNYRDKMPSSVQHFIAAQKNIIDRVSPSIPITPTSPITAAHQQSKKPQSTSSRPQLSTKTATSKFTFSGCLYAGFALLAEKCEGPNSLPNNYAKQNTLNFNSFKCDSSLIICNPLFYGFESDCEIAEATDSCKNKIRPLCIKPSISATANCRDKSKADIYLKRALALIKNEPSLFEQFTKDFEQLCNPELISKNRLVYFNSKGVARSNSSYIKNDILNTCQAAKPRLIQITNLISNAKSSSPTTPSHPTSPTATK